MNEMKVARGLGWFSIGLGLAEIVAGREIGRTLGMEDRDWLIRAYGVREIASGVAIFSQDKPRAGVWSRVAGDVLDLAALASAYREDNPKRDNVAAAIASIVGITCGGLLVREAAPQRPAARVLPPSISSTSPTGRAAAPPRENSRRPIGKRLRGRSRRGQTGPRPGRPRLSSGDHPNSEDLNTRGASMRALCWHGKSDVRVDTVPDPKIEDPRDAIIKITSTCICGSDLHLYDGYMPTMEAGDILGHEPMGEVVEVGKDGQEAQEGRPRGRPVHDLLRRVLVLQADSSTRCCDTLQPQRRDRPQGDGPVPGRACSATRTCSAATPAARPSTSACRYADVGPIKIPDGLPDEKVLFLSDIFPTGYMAAENAEIEPGDTVAVWGCGPVGQFAIQSAWMLGAGRVIAIDRVPERLEMAESRARPRRSTSRRRTSTTR